MVPGAIATRLPLAPGTATAGRDRGANRATWAPGCGHRDAGNGMAAPGGGHRDAGAGMRAPDMWAPGMRAPGMWTPGMWAPGWATTGAMTVPTPARGDVRAS